MNERPDHGQDGGAWYVVHSQPNAEWKAAEHLERQAFCCYLPTYLKQRRHARRIDTVKAPFFPRYLFVWLDVTRKRWRAIHSTVGVNRIVSRGLLPTPVMPGVVEALRQRENKDGLIDIAHSASRMRRGDRVRVVLDAGAIEAA